jgi:TfoX/Sxy family transcriptional regulator of competence genes
MFGNVAAFISGQMFAGLFGNVVFVRLDEAARTELLAEPGAGPFEPMKGRPMREYVALPGTWRDRPERARAWVARSLVWAATLPAKAPGQSRNAPKAPARRRS